MPLLKQIQKGFRTAGSQFRRFGKDVSHGLASASRFIEDKVLPMVSTVAQGVKQGVKYAMPAITAIAPELLPVAGAVIAGANAIETQINPLKQIITNK